MIEKPKKERRFLKTLGKIGEILLQEVLLKVGSNLVKRIGGKKTLPSILFLLLSISLFAQYPATGNKQRLGYQTTGDGLVYRGRALDTMTIKSSGLNNAYFILDTVNNILYNYIKTKGGWKFSNGDTVIINNTVDTTSLSNRINLKVNISDTSSMLLPYLRKADTASMLTTYFKKSDTTSLNLVSRFAAKQNILNGIGFVKASGTTISYDNSTYLTTSSAASTYLPLSGGTVTGNTSFTQRLTVGSSTNYDVFNVHHTSEDGFRMTYQSEPTTYYFQIRPNVSPSNVRYVFSQANLGVFYDSVLVFNNGNVSINKLNPAYKLDVNGTLGVTGATTLSSTISATTGTFTGLNVTNASTEGILTLQGADNNTLTRIQFKTDNIVRQEIIKPTSASNLQFRSYPTGTASGGYEFYVSNGSAESLAATIGTDKSLSLTGTLGVTGATTLSGALTVNNATVLNEGSGDFDTRIESDGNANMVFVDASTDRVGIGTASPSNTLDVNGTLGVTGIANFTNQMTISGSVSGSNRLLGKNTSNNGVGDITIGTGLSLTSNNLTASGTDTTSLSDRINLKYNSSGGTISGAVTLSTTTATPSSLLGKDGSNVVGQVTTLTQTGLMKASSVTQNTSSVGIITVAHGLSYTPSQVFVTVAQQSSYVAVCHAITSNDMSFTFYNSTTGIALNNVSVGFFWLAIK